MHIIDNQSTAHHSVIIMSSLHHHDSVHFSHCFYYWSGIFFWAQPTNAITTETLKWIKFQMKSQNKHEKESDGEREEKLEEKSQSRKNHNKRSHSFSNRSFIFCLQNFKFWIVVALNNVLLFVVIHSFISWKMPANTFEFFVFTLFFHSFISCVSFSI